MTSVTGCLTDDDGSCSRLPLRLKVSADHLETGSGGIHARYRNASESEGMLILRMIRAAFWQRLGRVMQRLGYGMYEGGKLVHRCRNTQFSGEFVAWWETWQHALLLSQKSLIPIHTPSI